MIGIKNSFNAGELSPWMKARTDFEKYYSGCLTLENMIVRPQGGVSKRPGTKYINTLTGKARLIPFIASKSEVYILEAGDQTIKIYPVDISAASVLTSIAVTGVTSIAKETQAQYTAMATYADSTEIDITKIATWTCEEGTVVSGLFTAPDVAETTDVIITASFEGIDGTLTVSVLVAADETPPYPNDGFSVESDPAKLVSAHRAVYGGGYRDTIIAYPPIDDEMELYYSNSAPYIYCQFAINGVEQSWIVGEPGRTLYNIPATETTSIIYKVRYKDWADNISPWSSTATLDEVE